MVPQVPVIMPDGKTELWDAEFVRENGFEGLMPNRRKGWNLIMDASSVWHAYKTVKV